MIFYWLFSIIAQVVFTIASKILILIDDISKYNFFSQGTINDFTNKVYVIIGVLMLFKLVISAVQYIVNPDMFDDKNKGLGAVLKKSIIVVVLLAIVPSIFALAMEIQSDIIDQIPKIIFGNNNYSIQNASENISMTVMSSFLNAKEGRSPSKYLESVGDFSSVATDGCGSISLVPASWANAITGEWCNYDYIVLLSPIAGVFLVYILISMTIDIATRAIKLGIVQILAPIPITSYITDEKKTTNWAKTSVQIYADLFIRLGVIYLVIYIIQVVMRDMFTSTGYEALRQGMAGATTRTPDSLEMGLIKVIIVIALLLFAKNAPKFITELLGLKGAGEGFNDMFKRAGGLFGASIGGLRTARSNFTTQKERYAGKGYGKGRQIAEGLRSAAIGVTSETGRGMLLAAQGKGFKDVRDTAFKKSIEARNRRIDREDNLYDDEYGYFDYKRDVRREKIGIPNTASFYEGVNKNLSQIRSSVDSQVSHGLKKLEDVKGQVFKSTDPKGFGTVTSMDTNGNTIVQQINEMSLATARARANAEIGSYYIDDEAMVNQRRVNLINKQHTEVVNLSQQITNAVNKQNAAIAAGKSQTEIDALGRIVQQLQTRYDSALQKENNMRNDDNLGKIKVTDEIRGQWDVLVHTLEKQARFQNEATLLAKGDVDAVVGNEKTLGLLRNNVNLDNDSLVQEAFKSLKANGSKFGSISELITALSHKNAKGGYDVDPSTIEAAKVISETLVRATNERAQINAERSKRTSQAISNEKNK